MNTRRRSFWGLIICISLFTGLFSGCEKSSGREKVKLVIKCPTLMINSVADSSVIDAEDFLEQAAAAFAAQYEAADVSVEIQVFDYTDEIEAVSGSWDTAEAADVLYEDYFNMSSYVYSGRVVPVDDIITEDIRSDIEQSAWDMSEINGKTYMMPYLSRQNVLMYNKALMEECGLSDFISEGEIQSWSIDEWTEILDTLAQKLPDFVYPMMMYGKNNQGDTHIMSFIRAFGSSIFDAGGNFDFEDAAAVEALSWIQGGVEKGWFPPHCENLEITDAQELFSNNQLVFYIFNNANTAMYDDLSDYGFVNFPGNVATSFMTGFEVFDNGDSEKIKAAKDFVKFIYENEEWLEKSAGNIPVSKRAAEKYADEIFMLDEFEANSENVVDFVNGSPNWQGLDTSVRSVFWPNIHKLLQGTVTPEECARLLDEECNNALELGWQNALLHE